jgi:hypothetical protein
MRVPFSSLVTSLREGQRGSVGDRKQDRTRSAFVAVEVAVSVLLLVGAARSRRRFSSASARCRKSSRWRL